MKKKNGVNYSLQSSAIGRRISAKERLKYQLKHVRKVSKTGDIVSLTCVDISRIKKEIEILNSRLL